VSVQIIWDDGQNNVVGIPTWLLALAANQGRRQVNRDHLGKGRDAAEVG